MMVRSHHALPSAIVLGLLATTIAAPAPAASSTKPAPAVAGAETGAAVEVEVGAGQLIALPRPAKSVFIANQDVADAQSPAPNRIFLFGKTAGSTTIYALDNAGGIILKREVVVKRNVAEITAALRSRLPQYALTVSVAPGSVVVAGQVDTSKDAEEAITTVEQFLLEKEKVVNRLTVSTPTQISLHVKVAEVSRDVSQKLGINWNAALQAGNFSFLGGAGRTILGGSTVAAIPGTGALAQGIALPSGGNWGLGGGYLSPTKNLEFLVDAMEQEGVLNTLAEPNLTAVSGQTASFLAGGEFPIPVAQSTTVGAGTAITVEYKQFGIALNFTPTVLSRNHISLHVRPEVSQISTQNQVNFGNGLIIPSLTVRRVDTTVELASGETLAIGGLLQNDLMDQVNKLPGLGNVPVLGRLFTSTQYQNHESELVVLVTPYVVRPMNGPSAAMTPIDALRPASDIEYVVKRDFGFPDNDPAAPRLHGPAGFLY